MKYLTTLIVVLAALAIVAIGATQTHAQSLRVLTGPQGGTGIGSATTGDVGNCLKVLSTGPLTYEIGTCGSGGGTFPFTPTTNFGVTVNGTSTPVWFQAGLMASSTNRLSTTTIYTEADEGFSVLSTNSGHIALFRNMGNGNAHASYCNTTTGCSTTDGSAFGIHQNGTALIRNYENAGLDVFSNNTTPILSLDGAGVLTLGQYGAGALSSNGSGVISAGTLAIANGGTGSTTAPQGQLLYGGASSYQSVATSTATCTSASGISCTPFTIVGPAGSTLSLASIPNSSLANSTISGIALGASLANLSVDATLSGSAYNGGTARTFGINLANGNTWTALQQFNGNASTSQFTSSDSAYLATTGGSVGVGTTSPSALFSVNPAAGSPSQVVAVGSSSQTLFGINANGGVQLAATQPATSTTITLDWSKTPQQVEFQIGTAAVTINLTNATTSQYWGSTKRVWICNPSGTAGALSWTGVRWIGGSAPTQTTTTNQCDLYSFNVTRATSTSAYIVAGAQSAGLQ